MDNQAWKYSRALPTTVDGLPVATTCLDITDNDPIQISLSEGADIQVEQSIVPSASSLAAKVEPSLVLAAEEKAKTDIVDDAPMWSWRAFLWRLRNKYIEMLGGVYEVASFVIPVYRPL
jgi:hypothetical protein